MVVLMTVLMSFMSSGQSLGKLKLGMSILGIYVGSIHNVLGNQKSKTAGGFRWEYVNKKNKKYG